MAAARGLFARGPLGRKLRRKLREIFFDSIVFAKVKETLRIVLLIFPIIYTYIR